MAYVVRGYRALLLTNRPPEFPGAGHRHDVRRGCFFLGGLFFRYLKGNCGRALKKRTQNSEHRTQNNGRLKSGTLQV